MKHESVELAIIGGGAAGLFAAAMCAEKHIKALVIERKARVGAKMLMTANGRCNFSKDIPPSAMLSDIGGKDAEFLAPALNALPPSAISRFFRAHGVKLKRLADGRLFPASEKAADIVHVFGDLLRDEGIPLLVNSPVTGIQKMKNGFIVGMRNFTIWAQNVLVATGGASFPKTGSTGDGQCFAHELGHRITPLRAGLTGFETNAVQPFLPPRTLESATASVIVGGEDVFSVRGEVDIERWGISGSAVYNCSRYVSRSNLKNFDIAIEGGDVRFVARRPKMCPLKEAIVTVGGVSLDEVDPNTMRSRLVEGLYFAGEVLDVDGPTGGYNLTIAFATAALAIQSISANH